MRRIFLIIVLLLVIAPWQNFSFAQALPPAKDQTTTLVGDATPPPSDGVVPFPSLPPNPSGSNTVAYWADVMASRLEKNTRGTYTKLTSPITNPSTGVKIDTGRYVCTELVIAAHRLAGERVASNTLVRYMQPNWEAKTGGTLINYTSNHRLISYVRPGDVFFQRAYGDGPGGFSEGVGHVSIVYSINIDENGDGIMITREANAPKTSIAIRFQNWEMHSYDWGGGFNAFLFGLHKAT